MKTTFRLLGIAIALVLLGAVMGYLAGFFEDKIAPEVLTVARESPRGELVAVEVVATPLIEQATGTVRAKDEAVISARLIATIAAISMRAGDAVAEGDVLVELDSRELQARLEQQRQAVRVAEARLAEAQSNYERIQPLAEQGVVAQAGLDQAEAALRATQAELDQSRRAVDEAITALSYSTIKAPLAGRVIERYADPGDTAIPGSPLLRLYDPSTLRLQANVRESLASTLAEDQPLRVRIDALSKEFPVKLDEIVPSADPGSRSFVVRVLLPTQANLYPGMFGRLLIDRGTAEYLRIPEQAIARFGQLEFVRVLTDEGVVRRYIRTGRRVADGYVEVLSGLTQGEKVVLPVE